MRSTPPFDVSPELPCGQIEYMVITFPEDGSKRALLSLRQSEILEELKNVVIDLKDEEPEKRWVCSS
jgi:hypothetical protein